MINGIHRFNQAALFWWSLVVLCLLQEAVALYYQYELGYPPCTLCVHVRAWVLAILLVSMAGVALRRFASGLIFVNALALISALAMLERSYLTFATERGWADGECGEVLANFPAWLPLDQWLPSVFQPLEPCGVTPWLLPSWLSIADGLLLFSASLSALFAVLLLVSILARDKTSR